MVLVDTNILLDIFTDDPRWADWSAQALLKMAEEELAINPIIYAELAPAYRQQEELDAHLSGWNFKRLEIPYAAGFLAGHVYARYRRSGGSRRSPLSDFYIGAHAVVEGCRLLTRDPARYRKYFPKLKVIAP